MSSYTVFIPRVFSNITQERISNVFHDLNIGSVEHVDLVPKTSANGQTYNMAFVHLAMIYNTVEAGKFRQEVEDPEKKAILQYDGPWFWLVLPFEQKDREKNVEKNVEKNNAKETEMSEEEHHNMMNGIGNQFVPINPAVPPPYEYLMANMVPVWVMTTYGPSLQWGCPQYNAIPTCNTSPVNTVKMVPPQVAYGKRNPVQCPHPRKKINVHRRTREQSESRSTTYAKEENHVSSNSNKSNGKNMEEGEVDSE
jgi:hypothetical protein